MSKHIIDNYKEHSQHDTYTDTCSECYKENSIIKKSDSLTELTFGFFEKLWKTYE